MIIETSNNPFTGWERLHQILNKTEVSPRIDKIFVNQPVVVVLWSDGTRTKSTCDANDQFDPFVGVSVCFAKKMVGKDKLLRLIKKAMK